MWGGLNEGGIVNIQNNAQDAEKWKIWIMQILRTNGLVKESYIKQNCLCSFQPNSYAVCGYAMNRLERWNAQNWLHDMLNWMHAVEKKE